jgi:hypothetical protein
MLEAEKTEALASVFSAPAQCLAEHYHDTADF